MPEVMKSTEKVLQEVYQERVAQEGKWGQQNHVPTDYFVILAEEFGEAGKEVVEARFTRLPSKRLDHLQNLREELKQTAAVAVAMIEALDRNAAKWGVDGFTPEPIQ